MTSADSEELSGPTFPLREFLGLTVEHGVGEHGVGQGTTRIELSEKHYNPNDVAHGAVSFAMMDTAMGAAVMSVVDEGSYCATIEIHTRFHRPASVGTLTAEATVLSAGRRIIHLEASTCDSEGRLVASATGSFAVISGPGS